MPNTTITTGLGSATFAGQQAYANTIFPGTGALATGTESNIALAQATVTGNNTSQTLSLTINNVTQGNTLVLGVVWRNATGNTFPGLPTDTNSSGAGWQGLVRQNGQAANGYWVGVAIYYLQSANGGPHTVTFTNHGSATPSNWGVLSEWTGILPNNAFDQKGTVLGTTAQTVTTGTASAVDTTPELLLSGVAIQSSSGVADAGITNPGFSLLTYNGNTSTDVGARLDYRVGSGALGVKYAIYAWTDANTSGSEAVMGTLRCANGSAPLVVLATKLTPSIGAAVLSGRYPVAPKRILITDTSATTYTLPPDWNAADNMVEVIGAGGAGLPSASSPAEGTGGGGGAYARISNLNLPVGTVVSLYIGTGGQTGGADGGDTWFNGASLAAASVGAKGGKGGQGSGSALGGQAAQSIGTVVFSGGSGGPYQGTGGGGEGGGGAAGAIGPGAQGGSNAAGATNGAGGGGSANGGSPGSNGSTTGGPGGNNAAGVGGGAGADGTALTLAQPGTNGGGGGGGTPGGTYSPGAAGGPGQEWSGTSASTGLPGTAGAGGGGGGSGFPGAPGNGGNYGGGGGGSGGTTSALFGTGAQGVIVLSYTPTGPGVLVNSGALTLGGYNPRVGPGFAPAAGALALTGIAGTAGIQAPGSHTVVPPVGSLTILGTKEIDPGQGALAFSGKAPLPSVPIITTTGSAILQGSVVLGLNLGAQPATGSLLVKPGDILSMTLTLPPPPAATLALTGGSVPVSLAEVINPTSLAFGTAAPAVGRGVQIFVHTAGTEVYDTFGRANENPLANGTWGNITAHGLQVSGGIANASFPSVCVSGWLTSSRTFGKQQYAEIAVGALTLYDDPGLGVLMTNTSGGTGYLAFYRTASQVMEIGKLVSGSYSVLTSTAMTFVPGSDTFGFSADSSTGNAVLAAYKNGASILNYTDSSSPYTTGQPALAYSNGGSNGTTITGWLAVDTNASSLYVTGVAPSTSNRTLYPNTATLTLAALAPVTRNGVALPPAFPAALTISGNAPATYWMQSQTPLTGALTFTSQYASAGIAGSVNLIAPFSGALALTATVPGFGQTYTSVPNTGAVSLNGAAALTWTVLTPSSAVVAATSYAPNTIRADTLAPAPASLLLVSSSGSVTSVNHYVNPQAGALSIASDNLSLGYSTLVTPSTGALTLYSDPPTSVGGNITFIGGTAELDLIGNNAGTYRPPVVRPGQTILIVLGSE